MMESSLLVSLSSAAQRAGVGHGSATEAPAEIQSLIASGDTGDFLWIPASVILEEPISVEIQGAATRLTVIVGERAMVKIAEKVTSGERGAISDEHEDSLRLHAVEVFVQDEASCEYVSLQNCSSEANIHITQRSHVGAGGSVSWRIATIGGGEVTQSVRSEITGADGRSDIDWLFYAKNQEKQTLSARNVFLGRSGGGEITMKGIAEDKGHTKCDGMIEIGLGGGGTDTYLTQDVLMLDKTAKVDAIPGLEIKTNDVKASHSATVSRVTAEDLFYFAARGIVEKEARKMFVLGFLGALTSRISFPGAAETVMEAVEGKYGV